MILVRHAKPIVDAAVPAVNWALSDAGYRTAERLGHSLPVTAATVIVASTERKAIETGAALTRSPVATSAAFCEVERPFYDHAEVLQQNVKAWFAGEAVAGWEPLLDAVARFGRGLEAWDRQNLIVVTHGTVMTAWLASMGAVDDPMAFWTDLRMPDAWDVGRSLVRCLP